MGFHHDKIKVDKEEIVMHSTVSMNSYNINAQATIQYWQL
jgi:hypothetical protein